MIMQFYFGGCDVQLHLLRQKVSWTKGYLNVPIPFRSQRWKPFCFTLACRYFFPFQSHFRISKTGVMSFGKPKKDLLKNIGVIKLLKKLIRIDWLAGKLRGKSHITPLWIERRQNLIYFTIMLLFPFDWKSSIWIRKNKYVHELLVA